MTDFSNYKAGDIMKLQVDFAIEEARHCSCCSPERNMKQIIAEFKILQVVERGEDFIFIFERSNVFEILSYITNDYCSVLINSFILDTADVDVECGYIIVLDKAEDNKRKIEAIKNLKKIIKDKSQGIEQYKTEYRELDKQMIALNDFAESPAFKLIANQITNVNIQINSYKEAIIRANSELKILENS